MILINEIVADRDWRMQELEFLKKLDKRTLYNQVSEKERNIYYRMCIPIIYAHWEGFISSSFKSLIDCINAQNLSRDEIINELFAFSQKTNFQCLAGKQNFRQRCEFSEKFIISFSKPFKIDTKLLSTKSNLKFEVLEEILSWFNMQPIGYQPYKQQINQLVNIRNAIAHGENSIKITYNDLEKYIKVVNDLFDITITSLQKYLLNEEYRKPS